MGEDLSTRRILKYLNGDFIRNTVQSYRAKHLEPEIESGEKVDKLSRGLEEVLRENLPVHSVSVDFGSIQQYGDIYFVKEIKGRVPSGREYYFIGQIGSSAYGRMDKGNQGKTLLYFLQNLGKEITDSELYEKTGLRMWESSFTLLKNKVNACSKYFRLVKVGGRGSGKYKMERIRKSLKTKI